ncbi:MAG: DUF6318 family protein [Aeromicrobium sp.]
MRRLGLACALLATLAACGREPTPIEPTATQTTPAHKSAPPSASSTLTPPKLPAIANRNDATAAANFVVYWVKVSNYAALTGDTDLLRRISDPNCEGCNRYIDLYEKTYAAGGYFRGGVQKVRSIEHEQGTEEHFFLCELQMPPGTYRKSRDSKPVMTEAETSKLVFAVAPEGLSWVVSQVGPALK